MDIPFKKTGYPLYSSQALIGSLHFLEVDKHGQQQGKIKTGLTQRRGESKANGRDSGRLLFLFDVFRCFTVAKYITRKKSSNYKLVSYLPGASLHLIIPNLSCMTR